MNKENSNGNIQYGENKYIIKDNEIIVTPKFKTDGKDTISTVLLRLMKSEVENH